MSDPIQLISALLNRVAGQANVEESVAWYLRSNLIDYKRVLLRKTSRQEIEFATGALMRFCAQNLGENMPLYRDCVEIAEAGARLAAQLELGHHEPRGSLPPSTPAITAPRLDIEGDEGASDADPDGGG